MDLTKNHGDIMIIYRRYTRIDHQQSDVMWVCLNIGCTSVGQWDDNHRNDVVTHPSTGLSS